ncbi:serine/threonine protein kinase, partial [Candidatus Peregrinibacteria bacterium]|nr:serine/threonine protein kinase [Candidatus Peregrinibacteria bacterium]
RIEAKLGEGGMGAVYKARQLSLDREVAIKILAPKLNQDPKFVERFKLEAIIAGRLNHKNIISVLETGISRGSHYYVMEYVEGVPLRKVLEKKKSLTEPESLKVIEDIAEAMEHSEKHKIIHRDIKPENIMMTKDGHAKLCDLGIAKQTHGELAKTLTATGEVFGTPTYVSPEQLEGEKLDIRSDIYSMGIVLYEMITGLLPFEGNTASEIALKRLTKMPLPPRRVNPNVSLNLNNLILRMMARDREHRFANPTVLIKSIQHLRKGGYITAPPKPYTKWVMLAAVVLIAIVMLFVLFTGGGSQREMELFRGVAEEAEKALAEGRFSEAASIVKSFKASEAETKDKAEELLDKINKSAGKETDDLAEVNKLIERGDRDAALNLLLKQRQKHK